jgi:hypothetical protein
MRRGGSGSKKVKYPKICEVCGQREAVIQCKYCGKRLCKKCYCPKPKSWDFAEYPRLCCGRES